MSETEFIVREAKVEDCAGILSLIKALAEHEKAADKVEMTEEVLKRDGFGEERLFHCLVAERRKEAGSGKLVGFALYYFVYSTWQGGATYLEDLCVLPEERGKGIGTTLWKSVAKIALRRNCLRLDFVCLGWNEKSMCYYKKNSTVDLTATEDWHLMRLKHKEMEELVSKVDGENIQCLI